MQRTTPLDAFNAAARFSQGVAGHYTEKNKEQNDLQLRVDNDKAKNRFADIVRDNPYTGGDFDVYRFKLNEEFDKAINSIIGESGNNSPYYRQMMEQSRRQWHVEADNTARVKADQWRTDKETVSCNEDMERIIEAVRRGDMTPQQGIEANRDRINLSGTIRQLSYQERYVMDEASKILTHQTLLTERLKNERDPSKLRGILAEANAEFDWTDEIDEATGEKKIKKFTYKDKDKFDEELLQGRCFEIFGEREALRRRLITDGGAQNLREANKIAEENSKLLRDYYDSDKPEYQLLNSRYRSQMDGWFKTTRDQLSAASSGTGAARQLGKKEIEDSFSQWINRGIDGYINNPDIRITPYDSYLGCMKELMQAANFQGTVEQFKHEYLIVNTYLKKFIDGMKDRGTLHEQYYDGVKIIADYLDRKYNEKDSVFSIRYKDQKQIILDRGQERFWDLIYSSDLSRVNGEEIAKQALNFVQSLEGQDLNILDGRLELNGANADQQLAQMLHAIGQPDRVWRDTQGRTQYNGVSVEKRNELEALVNTRLHREIMKDTPSHLRSGVRLKFLRFEESEGKTDIRDNTRYFDEDGVFIFGVDGDTSGREYKITSNGTELNIQKRERGSGWTSIGGAQYERDQRAAENQRMRAAAEAARSETIRREGQNELAMELSTLRYGGNQLRMPSDYTSDYRTGSPLEREDRLNYILTNYDKYINYLREYYGQRGQLPEELRRFDNRGRR